MTTDSNAERNAEILLEHQEVRFENAQKLLDQCLATRTGEFDWQDGVYAEIHGHDSENAILAVPPLLSDRQMYAGISEYNHSVFDDVGLAADEYPDIFELAHNKLGLRQNSTIHRGILSREDDGSWAFGITDYHGRINQDLMLKLKERYGISRFSLISERKTVDIDIDSLGTKLVVDGFVEAYSPANNPINTGVESGQATHLTVSENPPLFEDVMFGKFGSATLDASVVTSGHATHTQLINSLRRDNGDTEHAMSEPIEFGGPESRHQVLLRHTCDYRHGYMNIDLTIDPEDKELTRLEDIPDLVKYAGIILVGYLFGLARLDFGNHPESFRGTDAPGPDTYASKKTRAITSVYLRGAPALMQNVIEWPSFSRATLMDHDDLMENLTEGWVVRSQLWAE